jgi:hypothetical protein
MTKIKNIAFFGASITEQKSGYVNRFKELHPNFIINQFGYGGMYITDAGVCFIDELISTKPDYCFLDWFGPPRHPERIKDYLDAIVGKLFEISCHPIFLFFYRKQLDTGRFIMLDYLKAYASRYNINCINLSNLENPDQYLKDSVHTNETGAKKYGDIISEEFNNMIFENCINPPDQNKFSKINSIDTNIVAKDHIKLKSVGCSSIIGVMQNIGLYTEDVTCLCQDKEYVISLKDKWSEKYERKTMKFNVDFCGEMTIKIPNNKKLIWKKLFYIGDDIKIIEYK